MTEYRIGQALKSVTHHDLDGTSSSLQLAGALHALPADQVTPSADPMGTALCGQRVSVSGEKAFDPTMDVREGYCRSCKAKASASGRA